MRVIDLRLPDPPLRDERVLLRSMVDDDVAWVAAASRDELIPRFTRVPVDNTEAGVRAFVMAQPGLRSSGRELHLIGAEARSGARIGMIGLHHVDADARSAHVGYWTALEARGQGLTTTAVRLLATWALTTLGLERLELRADVENLASQRVAERVGFTHEGVLRDAEWRPGGRRSQAVYGLLASELT